MTRSQITLSGSLVTLALAMVLLVDRSEPTEKAKRIPATRNHWTHSDRMVDAASSKAERSGSLRQRIQAALETNELENHDLVFGNLLLVLIEEDPLAAVALSCAQPSGPIRERMLHRIAQHWTPNDPDAALTWARQLSDERERELVTGSVYQQIAQSTPSEAVQLASGDDEGCVSWGTLENLMLQWASQDFDAAERWVDSLAASDRKDGMFLRLASLKAQADPLNAALLVADRMTGIEAQDKAVISVVHQWSLADPTAAGEWVELFPVGPLRERALREIEGTLSREVQKSH